MKHTLRNITFALLAVSLVATTTTTFWLYAKVQDLQKERNSTVSSNISPAQTGTVPEGRGTVPQGEGSVPQETEGVGTVPEVVGTVPEGRGTVPEVVGTVPAPLTVKRFEYNGRDEIGLYLSARPDMEVVRHYVTVEPLEKGTLSFSFKTPWNWDIGQRCDKLVIRGDFAHRTNVTLRVRAGFPAFGTSSSTNLVAGPLEADYVRTFTRNDEEPRVGFANNGRYLPPAGARAVAISSVNVPKVRAQIRRVPSANIVQMLALEECAYDKVYATWNSCENDGFMTDLSYAPTERFVETPNGLNTKETTYLRIDPDDGGATNGLFLVTLSRADKPCGGDDRWSDNRAIHRVVCLSDLGLSVRRGPDSVFVWTTSLTRGVPVGGAEVSVYSKANILIGKGVTDANGWSAVKVDGTALADQCGVGGEPFAVVVSMADGSDASFIALTDGMQVDEQAYDSTGWNRDEYLGANDVDAFLWTERGIYRHGEPIFVHALLRNVEGLAPKPFPIRLELESPLGNVTSSRNVMADRLGALADESFAVPAEQPGGSWTIRLKTPGEKGRVLAARSVKVEEFAPPQIRVKVAAARSAKPQDFHFDVTAEHLYGGPASALACDGAVVFEDAPFAPEGWSGWSFGSEDRGLKPSFRELAKDVLDEKGAHVFSAPIWADYGRPRAAVKAIAQGTVFEDGGRPATARDTALLHYYPFYIGSTLGAWVRKPEVGRPVVSVACVAPDGRRLDAARTLTAKLERVESVYSYRRGEDGWATWDCERVRSAVAERLSLDVPSGGDACFEIPADACGDYVLTIEDAATGVAFARSFYLSDWGDGNVRAPLANPVKVSVETDKPFYRVGERPRLVVKSPFAGTALLSVVRDDIIYSEVLALTNATSEILLRPCAREWAPNAEVRLSVVQGVAANAKGLAARAHGEATVRVRPVEREIAVSVAAEKADVAGDSTGGGLRVRVVAPGAERAVVTVVDEGINILTDERTPDPVGYFARPRTGGIHHSLFDLYHRILPVLGDDVLKAGGVKTGGGYGAEMLGRVSPVPTRRFKPLALWKREAEVKDGVAEVVFSLPEFVGEVRASAVAYSASAEGASSVQCKVCPSLVMEPDAPRFAAPGDEFGLTLPLSNMSGEDGEIAYQVTDGRSVKSVASGTVRLAAGESTVLRFTANAPSEPGQLALRFVTVGCGERHEKTIELPVRPAVPWRDTAGVALLDPGEVFELPADPSSACATDTVSFAVSGTPVAELKDAYEWLADYPHGCLEQTSSRMFPLLRATSFLPTGAAAGGRDVESVVAAGVSRVESMIRENDFVMWPDCSYAPWDVEVSLYAAHFLVEAERTGCSPSPAAKAKVMRFLARWAMSSTNSISAYACHTLALAGRPEKDRMLRLYDDRERLDLLSRARLARAFVATADLPRAEALLANAASPADVREASFLLLALVELDGGDLRAPALVKYLLANRVKARFCWGTTGENAHALLALGAWYAAHPPKEGRPEVVSEGRRVRNTGPVPAYVTWRRRSLPRIEEDADEETDIVLKREYLDSAGCAYDLGRAKCGDLVIVRLTLGSRVARDCGDLVIEDLLPAAFEPVLAPLDPAQHPWLEANAHDWVMRSDARDDRMLVFSKRFRLCPEAPETFSYPVRIVTPGVFTLPGCTAEAMYQPSLRARIRASRLGVR